MATLVEEHGTIAVADDEQSGASEIARILQAAPGGSLRLVGADGGSAQLPAPVVRALARVVAAFARGEAVSVQPVRQELPTGQAADLLNVSREYLIRLLDEGAIPSTGEGTLRRVRLEDVLSYRVERDARREVALRELVRLSQEMGLYDENEPGPRREG